MALLAEVAEELDAACGQVAHVARELASCADQGSDVATLVSLLDDRVRLSPLVHSRIEEVRRRTEGAPVPDIARRHIRSAASFLERASVDDARALSAMEQRHGLLDREQDRLKDAALTLERYRPKERARSARLDRLG